MSEQISTASVIMGFKKELSVFDKKIISIHSDISSLKARTVELHPLVEARDLLEDYVVPQGIINEYLEIGNKIKNLENDIYELEMKKNVIHKNCSVLEAMM